MAVASKKKTTAAALHVPQTDDEANALLAQYGELFNQAARIEADMNDALAKVKAGAETIAKPVAEQMQAIETALNAFAGANRKRLTHDGKVKTVRFAAGEMGWRFNPPSVRFVRGVKAEHVIESIRSLIRDYVADGNRRMSARLQVFIRTKHEPNKEAMAADPETAMLVDGVKIGSSGEKFYLAPFGAELSEAGR
jgi:phage host-nuclease inhibitor protein Gam